MALFVFDINGVTEVEENDSNETLACDDVAHKVALYTPSLFLDITQVELLICCLCEKTFSFK